LGARCCQHVSTAVAPAGRVLGLDAPEGGGAPSPVRTPRGRYILAACGQPKTASQRQRQRAATPLWPPDRSPRPGARRIHTQGWSSPPP
jgi:hypothetical protein